MTPKTFLAAAALAGLSFTAQAAPVSLVATGPGVLTGAFTQPVDDTGIPFVDTFTFLPAAFTGLVSVNLTSLSGPVTFFSASLTSVATEDFTRDPGLTPATDFAFQAFVMDGMPLTLTVFGAVLDANLIVAGAGSYGGTITAAAVVPEPQAWALMLAALAGLGATTRRKDGGRRLTSPA